MGKKTSKSNVGRWVMWTILGVLVIVQLIPLERTNPRVVADIDTGPDVKQVLRNSCFDCHSNETDWPWYAYVAPLSWSVVSHVHEGREHLNFSEWGTMSVDQQRHARGKMWEEIEKGEMPLPAYTMIHRDAILTPEQLNILKAWLKTQEAPVDSRATGLDDNRPLRGPEQ